MRKSLPLASIGVLLCGIWGCSSVPQLTQEQKGPDLYIHFETLGEYPTTVRSFQITELNQPRLIVLQMKASKDTIQTHNFRLHTGTNQIGLVDREGGSYQAIVPTGTTDFTLYANTSYVAKICGSYGICRKTVFLLPS
jgi:hypothetical protein